LLLTLYPVQRFRTLLLKCLPARYIGPLLINFTVAIVMVLVVERTWEAWLLSTFLLSFLATVCGRLSQLSFFWLAHFTEDAASLLRSCNRTRRNTCQWSIL
jgi:hypothetical protein